MTLIDEFTRECLAIRVARRINGFGVIETMADAMLERGVPEHIRSDNGAEMTAKIVRSWLAKLGTAVTRCNSLYAAGPKYPSGQAHRRETDCLTLNLRLVRMRRFSSLMCRWQLKHSGLLSLLKQSQKNDLAVREFQGVVVRPGDVLIDLAEDRGLVFDSAGGPRPQTYPSNLVGEGQLCARQ
jgi:hypothetical protein